MALTVHALAKRTWDHQKTTIDHISYLAHFCFIANFVPISIAMLLLEVCPIGYRVGVPQCFIMHQWEISETFI